MSPGSRTEPEEGVSAAVLLSQMEALGVAWRRTADRLERYSPPAAEGFRQAAADLERLRTQHGQAVDVLRALRDYLAARG